jgi:activating signal cointegrator complex subunit 1
MHLTLGVMALSTEKLAEAEQLLDGAVRNAWVDANTILTGTEASQMPDHPKADVLKVELKSLVAMTGPKTSVLFADPVDTTNRLRPFCEALRKQFEKAGLIESENRELKLHATVLNTVYGKTSGNERGGRNARGPPKKIDPQLLVDACQQFEWVTVQADKVAICKMGAKNVFDSDGEKVDEEYEVVTEVDICL